MSWFCQINWDCFFKQWHYQKILLVCNPPLPPHPLRLIPPYAALYGCKWSFRESTDWLLIWGTKNTSLWKIDSSLINWNREYLHRTAAWCRFSVRRILGEYNEVVGPVDDVEDEEERRENDPRHQVNVVRFVPLFDELHPGEKNY